MDGWMTAALPLPLLILVGAALLVIRAVLAEALEGVVDLELVPGVAGRRAQLLDLIPRRGALSAGGIFRARRLCVLYAFRHLLRDVGWRRGRAGDETRTAGVHSVAAGPWGEPRAGQWRLGELCLRGDEDSWDGDADASQYRCHGFSYVAQRWMECNGREG
ncbi:unnamed protein product, partial [Musa acuminata subsp. burmannicoides]